MVIFSGNYRCASTDRGCTSQNHRHDAVPIEDLLAEKTKKLKQWQKKTRQEVLAHNFHPSQRGLHRTHQRQLKGKKEGKICKRQSWRAGGNMELQTALLKRSTNLPLDYFISPCSIWKFQYMHCDCDCEETFHTQHANNCIKNLPPSYPMLCNTAGADCKVSNTRMFQGQSFEGGTFESQLVRWSVKIVRELPSFSL